MADLAFQAGESGVALGIVDQLQAVEAAARLRINVVVDLVVEGAERKRGAAGQLAQREVDVVGSLARQVRVADLVRAKL